MEKGGKRGNPTIIHSYVPIKRGYPINAKIVLPSFYGHISHSIAKTYPFRPNTLLQRRLKV